MVLVPNGHVAWTLLSRGIFEAYFDSRNIPRDGSLRSRVENGQVVNTDTLIFGIIL